MSPKQILPVILLVGVLGFVAGRFWPVSPSRQTADEQSLPSSEQTGAGEDIGASDALPDGPLAAGVQLDPAMRQAVLEAIAQLQQQQEAQAAEDARIERTVRNNLRQLSQGATTYFTERGVSSVTSVALVGTNSSQYVKPFAPVAGEIYPAVILQGQPINAFGVSGARDFTSDRGP